MAKNGANTAVEDVEVVEDGVYDITESETSESESEQSLQEKVSLDRQPGESMQNWLDRLEAETRVVRAAAQRESKEARERELALATESIEPVVKAKLAEIESESGKEFRSLRISYTKKANQDVGEWKTSYILVRPRSTD